MPMPPTPKHNLIAYPCVPKQPFRTADLTLPRPCRRNAHQDRICSRALLLPGMRQPS
jgi:hypothetical protein